MGLKGRRFRGRPPSAEEKTYIAEWFSANFKEDKISHTEYIRALKADMVKQGFDPNAVS